MAILIDYLAKGCVVEARIAKEADIKSRSDIAEVNDLLTVRGWTAYIHETYGTDARGVTYEEYLANKPEGADLAAKTHGHHIVFKKGLGASGQAASKEGRDILLYRGIDPYYGKENLVYAPNKGHKDSALIEIVKNLKDPRTFKPKSTSSIIAVLKDMALLFIKQELPGMDNH